MHCNYRVFAVSVFLTLGACAGQTVQKANPGAQSAPGAASNVEQMNALYARPDAEEKSFTAAHAA